MIFKTATFKLLGLVLLFTCITVAGEHNPSSAALETSPTKPGASQMFLSANCEYALYVALWPDAGSTLDIAYVAGFPGRRVALDVGVIRLKTETADSVEWNTSCNQFDPYGEWGGSRLADEVQIDADGNGVFETSGSPARRFWLTFPDRSNFIYSLYVKWTSPGGETLVGKINVFVDVDCGISINEGAEYTNSRDVTVTVNPCPGAEAVRISNDGSFAVREVAVPGSSIDWTIESNLVGTFTKVVYARYLGGSGGAVSDDIILDTTTPVVSNVSASLSGRSELVQTSLVRLTISARDTISGVGRMQITNNRGKPGKWLKFSPNTQFANQGEVIFVRVKDRAGNISTWRTLRAG
jgi:hypothetical protein